ncbi:signal peptidase [Microbacterium halimionae]|uniref:Signal peptidase I n=1 Tax=Microbacterium halimionae TaxID=1526413 RepID=A0A7W3JMQ0_9MICO|nr:signal peptidase I [Microbacterium halimionae]MBA8815677.1 signal peptidase [Microbacterium halimionae]NII95723.1 signal peptidase [Microbacterium halimionae]
MTTTAPTLRRDLRPTPATITVRGAQSPRRQRGRHVARHHTDWQYVGDRAQSVVVGGVAVVAIASALWFVVSALFHLALVIILTGSMAPSMPAGTLIVVQDVRATALQVGDVVTVPRETSSIPVTHRIVSIETDAADGQVRFLTMQGDANARADTEIYRVRDAQRVVFSLPGVGTAIGLLGSPLFVGIGTLIAAIIIAWVMWPTRDDGAE